MNSFINATKIQLRNEINLSETKLKHLIDNNKSYYKQIFEHYYYLLDPNDVVVLANQAIVVGTCIDHDGQNDGVHLGIRSNNSLSDFALKYGFKISNGSLGLSGIDDKTNYTFFFLIKHQSTSNMEFRLVFGFENLRIYGTYFDLGLHQT